MSIISLPFAGLELGFAVSLACSLLLVLTTRWHGRYSLDATHGVQKFHTTPTPRIGGSAIMLSLWLSLVVLPAEQLELLLPLLVSAMPAFGFGLAEDLTRNVSVRSRLLATVASGVCCWGLTGVTLLHVGIAPVDMMLTWLPASVLFTAFAVGGVANAINIIDGFNGLASGTVLIGMAAFGIIAQDAGDATLAQLCLVVCAVTAGFFVVNFPFGKLFLGDGGAYLLGFLLAWLSVMLVYRNPLVSPLAPMLACSYPIFETVFTIARRLWCRRHPGHPDSWHLHSLVKTVIAARYFRALPAPLRNACVSPFSWAVSMVSAMMAVRFASVPEALLHGVLASFLLYLSMYGFVVSVWWARRRRTLRPAPHSSSLADVALSRPILPISSAGCEAVSSLIGASTR